MLLEVCIDDALGLEAARIGGADRVELCSSLLVGGLTPSPGLMALAAASGLPSMVMIRPRSGDFVYSRAEEEQMLAEIDAVRAAGLTGVVLGASLTDGRLDTALLSRLCRRAEGLDLTLHRAFDLVPDTSEAVSQAVDLGFSRILTSGRALSAFQGLPALRAIATEAEGRISIMPGGGISAANVTEFLSLPGVTEVHASGSREAPPPSKRVEDFGFDLPGRRQTSAEAVGAIKAAMSLG